MQLVDLIQRITAINSLQDVSVFRQCVTDSYQWIDNTFPHCEIDEIILGRAYFVDALVRQAWTLSGLADVPNLSLAAVGGYGRGQLQPHSDVDLLILSRRTLKPEIGEKISAFITLLWDCKLDIGQSVRTIKDCIEQAKSDITVATNLVEARCLIGCQTTFDDMLTKVNNDRVWTSQAFFLAKYEEQKQRHLKFHGTAYNLEPNVKENPGCLRDIQSIGWVAKKHFQEFDGYQLVGHGYFTEMEHQELIDCRRQLWRIRCALHIVAGRSENRLLFDYQSDVAHKLGYQQEDSKAVEHMMKSFFRVTRRVSELNTMLLQRFKIDILGADVEPGLTINDNFYHNNGLIVPQHTNVFQSPLDILQFLEVIAHTPEIRGLDGECIRQLRNARRKFATQYWQDYPECREQFLKLMRTPNFFDFAWDVMFQYGILQSYLPQWDAIVGMMQFDLFHAYTVDEHTHRLVKNLYLYTTEDNSEFPRCKSIVTDLEKPELLYLAGIFHDIAKGRGGDHSKLGAQDVIAFGEKHELSPEDIQIISWLVDSHLLMSVVAQRRDIYDPEVIHDFATAVKTPHHLNLLYALTLADIRATNDNLWNDWKSSLLKELYVLTQNALANGLQCQVSLKERAQANRESALLLLLNQFDKSIIDSLWTRFDDAYFTRYKPIQIAWHTEQVLHHGSADQWHISMANHTTKAGTELLVYGKDRPAVFAQIASVLDAANLSILDANIAITDDGYVFDSIIVVDEHNHKISSEKRRSNLCHAIEAQLEKPENTHHNQRKLSRQLKQLSVPTKVRFFETKDDATLIELEALDSPGLLAKVGHLFVDFNLTLRLAKISTIGERAEDVFIVIDAHGRALSTETQLALKKQIIKTLDQAEH